jgi:hypothetical protein
MNSTATKVSVGLSTVFGLSASAASYIGAAVSAVQGDHSQQTLALLGSGVLSLGAVVYSRGKQAVAHIHATQFVSHTLGEAVHIEHPTPDDPITAALRAGTVTGNLTVAIAPPAPETPPVA